MSKDIDRTLWVGNLSEKITDDILYELFLQAGPLEKVSVAKERDGRLKGFAFITFSHEVSVPYTIQLMDGVTLYGKNLRLQSRPGSVHQQAQQQQHQMENVRNPYQNNSPVANRPYYNHQPMQNPPANPYTRNQPMVPQFHRSHTWHGGDLSAAPQGVELQQSDRDRDNRSGRDGRGREGRDKDSNRYSHQERDRSGSRHRTERIEDYRNSPNSSKNDDYNNSDNFQARRQKVLERHDRMLQGQKHDSRYQGGYDRRGRY